jgi:hypothetical protein
VVSCRTPVVPGMVPRRGPAHVGHSGCGLRRHDGPFRDDYRSRQPDGLRSRAPRRGVGRERPGRRVRSRIRAKRRAPQRGRRAQQDRRGGGHKQGRNCGGASCWCRLHSGVRLPCRERAGQTVHLYGRSA